MGAVVYLFSIQSASHYSSKALIMKIVLALLLTLAVVSCQVPDLCPVCTKELGSADYATLVEGLNVALTDGQLCTDCPACTDLDATLIEFINLAIQLLEAGTDATLLCQLMGLCPA